VHDEALSSTVRCRKGEQKTVQLKAEISKRTGPGGMGASPQKDDAVFYINPWSTDRGLSACLCAMFFFSVIIPLHIPHFSSLFLLCSTLVLLNMTTTQIQCPRCLKFFSHRGLSQHVSKSRDARCRTDYSASHTPSVSTHIPHKGSFVQLDSIDGLQTLDVPDSNIDTQNSDGTFANPHVSSILLIFRCVCPRGVPFCYR
jgi:hypothetical protein